ncbi:MAG: LysM peptidoglycan-binding domain-containing protein [Chloroflexi bacterium]|nr:LysM peptidoglycan-binding domain-containing protein [Chloroflexota bacterium]
MKKLALSLLLVGALLVGCDFFTAPPTPTPAPTFVRKTPVPTPKEEISQPKAAAPTATVEGTVYTVQGGDTLFGIAQKFGTTVEAILKANDLSSPDKLSIGQKLTIPKKAP